MSSQVVCFVCNLPILTHQVGLVWQGGNGIDELLRDFEGPNALTALRTRLGRRDSATQFRAVSPPRTVRETSPPGTAGGGRDGGRRRSSLAQITDLLWGSKDKSNAGHHNNTSVPSASQGGIGSGNNSRSRAATGRRESLVDMAFGNLPWIRRQSSTTSGPSSSSAAAHSTSIDGDKLRKRRESMTAAFPKRSGGRRDSGVGSGGSVSGSSVGLDISKFQFLMSRRDRDSSLPAGTPGISRTDSTAGIQRQSVDGNLPTQTVELSQALRERLKERHDSIGFLSRRRCSGISPLARNSAGSRSGGGGSISQHSSAGSVAGTSTVATSPSGLGLAPVSPTFPSTTTVVVTSSASVGGSNYYGSGRQGHGSPSSPRQLSPVQGSVPTSPRCQLVTTTTTTANCGTSPDHSLCPIFSATSIPPSPEGRSTSPFGSGAGSMLNSAANPQSGPSSSCPLVVAPEEHFVKPILLTSAPSTESTTSIHAPIVSTPVVVELATLGVSRHRRRSRPSSSPERPCSSSPSTSGRLPRLRRQSTTLDEGIPIGGKTGRRGSRPFLSPDAPPAATLMAALQTHRDSLSPDSAAEEALSGGAGLLGSTSKLRGRRDSRPHLSPDGECGGDGSSPRGSRIRRQSTTTEDIFKCRSRRGSKATTSSTSKPCRSESSSTCSSREPSPKEPSLRRQSTTTEEILIARGFRRQSTTEEMMRCRNFRRQSTQSEELTKTRGRRDSCAQISDGTVATMTVETTAAFYDTSTQTEPSSVYDNNIYHEECLRCNACGVNLTGPSQKRARRFKNQIFCDLHFADVALMESSDFMQQLRSFKPQSLGCAVARRKSSTTLIFPLPPQACSDEFCDGYPHNFTPTPGYWIECSRQSGRAGRRRNHGIQEEGSQEDSNSPSDDEDDEDDDEEEGEKEREENDNGTGVQTDSFDGGCSSSSQLLNQRHANGVASVFTSTDSIGAGPSDRSGRKVQLVHQHIQVSSTSLPEIHELQARRKTAIEEQFDRAGTFELTSVEQETYERYFYGTEHWNYFSNDEDLGPVVLSLKQEIINGRDQFRILVRAISYTVHGLIPASCVFADRYNREEVVRSLGKEINLNPPLILGQLPDTPEELLKLDQVFIKSELKVGVIYVKDGQYTEEEILDNNEHSPLFDEFLQIIGDKVRLKGFDKYKGGLDTVHDLTGLYSVYTHWRGIEIMFHVSTLLPYEKNDPQKLQRKRHVGNDIVCVVFLESNTTDFSPACIKSHFLHTFILVQVSPKSRRKPTRYEVSVVTRDEVGAYKPYLWEQSTFHNGVLFREWMLTKIVNGERASYSAPKFARMQERTRSQMLEDIVANLQNHAETGQIPKPYRRGSWRPIGHMRPSSPLLDSVRDQFEGYDQLAKDFSKVFLNLDPPSVLFDVSFLVGQGKTKLKLYGVRAILGVRSRVFQEMLYGICTGFGSPQVPVAELLARAAPTLHSPGGQQRHKSSNFLQVPDIESPRPKSVPSSPSVMRAFSRLGNLTAGWGRSSKKQDRLTVDDKKWTSSQDCTKMGREGRGERGSAADRAAAAAGNSNNSLAVPRLSVCADVQKVDRSKLAQTEFAIIEFDAETFRLLLDYLHTGSCPCTCNNIPGLICAAEHYDLPELLQACFHHAKQFLRIEVVCSMLCLLENYYWRYTSASELVNMILLFIETRAYQVFQCPDFLSLSESIVQMIMARNLEVPEVRKFEAMLVWAKHKIRTRGAASRVDAKIEFRCTMERLTRDLRLYRISPQDLIKIVLPSKAIKNERILETLMFQANSGMYRIQDSYLEACQQRLQKQDSRFSEWDSFDYGL